VISAGKNFAHTLRTGFSTAFELASFSALGVSLAALMWTVVTPRGATAAASTDVVSAPETASNVAARLSRTADPFARKTTRATASIFNTSGFTLHATRVWNDGGGTAIISPAGGSQGAFGIGEEIAAGVVLSVVATDHVEIDVSGRRMRVAFPDAAAPNVLQPTPALPENFQAAARSAPVLSSLPMQPVSRNGQPSGFEVMPQADSATLAAAGLQVGDIVLSINGVAAATADLSAYRSQLASGAPVEIRFERNGQIHTTRLGTQ
jgi:general secretion pathway protein C